MKKIFLAILVIITLSVSLISYQTGIEAQHHLVNLNHMLSAWVDMKLLHHDYDRGWWNSDAHSRFEMKNPWIPKVTLVHKIHHGILPLWPVQVETSSPLDDKTDLFRAQTFVQLSGESVSEVVVPTQKFFAGNESIEWETWTGEVRIQRVPAILTVDLHIPKIRQHANAAQGEMHHLNLSTQIQLNDGSALEGTGHMQIEEIAWRPQQIHLKGVHLTMDKMAMDREGYLSAQVHLESNTVQWDKDSYEKGRCDGELNHINISTLKRMREIWETHASERSLVILGKLLPEMFRLMKSTPELKLTQVSLQTHEGILQGQGYIKVGSLDLAGFFNPLSFLNTLEAQLELTVPKGFLVTALLGGPATPNEAARTEQSLRTWLDQGLFVKTQENMYYTHLKLKEGRLQINGKIVPFVAL